MMNELIKLIKSTKKSQDRAMQRRLISQMIAASAKIMYQRYGSGNIIELSSDDNTILGTVGGLNVRISHEFYKKYTYNERP